MKTILVREILRKHWLRVCRSFVLPLITCLALAAAFGCNGCSSLKDMDDDGVADAIDNCPITANANQADADGNGVGDACQGEGLATGDSLAYQTDAGVAEARFDQRLRSVQMAIPGQVATLVWPADSSHVDIELVLNRIRTTSSTPVDFTDAALLAALDAAEDEGVDVTVYRQYVADHPGQILQIVTGLQPPSSASKNGRLGQDQQVLDPTVARYLLRLAEASLICRATANAFRERLTQTQDPQLREHYLVLLRHFVYLAGEIDDVYDRQEVACIVCTDNCNVPCAPPETTDRACCIYNFGENRVDCIDTNREDCEDNWSGEYDENYSCGEIYNCDQGACCIDVDDLNPEPPDFNQKPQCAPNTRQACEQMDGSKTGDLVWHTEFHVGKECSEIKCEE